MSANEWALIFGPALGAGITVLGVHLTNRANTRAQACLLTAQEQQHRDTLQSDLRGEHIRSVLRMRTELYSELLRLVDAGANFLDWMKAYDDDPRFAEPDGDDLHRDVRAPLRAVKYRVEVVCPGEVRAAMDAYLAAVTAICDGPWNDASVGALGSAGQSLRECVVQHAILDRTSGITPEGLGGM